MRLSIGPLAERISGLGWERLARRFRRTVPSGSPRVAVIGNCQGDAVAAAMRLLLPRAEVTYRSVYRITRRYPAMDDLVQDLAGYDVVFAGAFAAPFRDGGDFETLRAATRLVQIPTIVFSAFHPDVVYVGDLTDETGRRFVPTPVGAYNSALALFGYLEGFSPAETLRLFKEEVYRRVGYMQVWGDAHATLIGLGRDAGYDLQPDLARWTRRGCFMHLINHPRMFVANDLARGLLRKAAIAFEDCDLDSYAVDNIVRLGAWPVHPPIAQEMGLVGSDVFLAPAGRRQPARTLALRDFIDGSFASYRARPRASLKCERVEQWLQSDPLRSDLKAAACG
jgi:hypothetical protein